MKGLVQDIRSILIQQGVAKQRNHKNYPSWHPLRALESLLLRSPSLLLIFIKHQLQPAHLFSCTESIPNNQQKFLSLRSIRSTQSEESQSLRCYSNAFIGRSLSSCSLVSSPNLTPSSVPSLVVDGMKNDPFPQTTILWCTSSHLSRKLGHWMLRTAFFNPPSWAEKLALLSRKQRLHL